MYVPGTLAHLLLSLLFFFGQDDAAAFSEFKDRYLVDLCREKKNDLRPCLYVKADRSWHRRVSLHALFVFWFHCS